MTTSFFGPAVSFEMQKMILAELRAIEAREEIRILFAVESGSRAWGFPSPDSDYDIRFVYAHPTDWYLSITPGRDVIERPIVDELDMNGWDTKKALGLLLKPNPVLLEWLSSPIRYLWDEKVCERLVAFSKKVAHGPACTHHYLNTGQNHWSRHIAPNDQVNLKKYFYTVRPAMALRWLRLRPEASPPMNFRELLAGIDPPPDLTRALEELLIPKGRSRERGRTPRIAVIDTFMTAEFDRAREAATGSRTGRHDLANAADALFREIVKGSA